MIFSKKSFNPKKRGSLTIELSLLIPLILGTIVLILFLGFYMHDRCIMTKACHLASLRAGSETSESLSREKAAEMLDEAFTGKLIRMHEDTREITVSEENGTVRITLKGSMGFDRGLLFSLSDRNEMNYTVTDITCMTDEEDFARKHKIH
ncbi:MAG: pilus assembly protein [Lachnospiraceae bacterium]|nr:pilus assembly protein [Lachnospiraceae bacterium]